MKSNRVDVDADRTRGSRKNSKTADANNPAIIQCEQEYESAIEAVRKNLLLCIKYRNS